MRKLTKTLAALLLMLAVVVAAGCKKPDDPTDPNNPNNGGGNGGGETPTTEGIYLGIIGFNYNLFPKEISFLDNTTKSSFTSFIDNLTTENLTALYYADYAALKNLKQYGEPPRLTNVALVTFTDGLDNASLDDEERNPENYPTTDAYLNALHSKIMTEQIHGMNVNAYTIGLRGNDVQNVVAFQNNLKKLASNDQNVFEVTSMDEALQHFEEIAESLHWTSVTTSLTLLVPPGYDDGKVLRFTFDQGGSAANSTLCIECTYKRGDNVRRLENIQYIGFEQGASSLSSVEKLPNGFYKFVFEQLEKKNGQGYITEDDRNRLKLYRRISTGWEPETEFDNSNQSSIVNEQNSALIMLVLDCTTSLGSQFSSLKVGAKNFVETLVNANSGGGGLTRFTVSVSANPNEAGTVSGGGTFNSGALRTITATANDGYAFTNWTENGNEVSTNPNYSFTLNTNRTFVANFTATAPNQYTINVSANPTEGGTVSGGGVHYYGQACTVHAVANSGYTFTNWTENGSVVSTNASYNFTATQSRSLVAHFQQQTGDQTFTVNGVSFTMKRVAGGTFWMGAQSANPNGQNYDSEASSVESPVHSVTLSTFYMGETEVTQELWQAVMGSNPSYFSGTNRPVERVSWNMIVNQFIPALNALTGRTFRLPTEAEWEYAARGGNQGHGYKYAGSNTIWNVAWFSGNSGGQTHQVATKSPNELGLYDMSGNVWEWCQDWYGGAYGSNTQTDPQGPSSGQYRVLRGGSWFNYASSCRVTYRNSYGPDYRGDSGFRVVLVP